MSDKPALLDLPGMAAARFDLPNAPRRGARGRHRAFTLVEMLMVIGVIAILCGLILAGLGGAMRTAAKTRELNNLRQLFHGWTMYSSHYSEYFPPAHLDVETQQAWNVTYRDHAGNTLAPELCEGYGWRLAGYLDYEFEPMLSAVSDKPIIGNQDPAAIASLRTLVAQRPSFGLNSYFVGGWWETTPGNPPQMRYDDLPFPNLIARTQGSIARPSEQIVFISSARRTPGVWRNIQSDDELPGSPYADAPRLPTGIAWQEALGDSGAVQVVGNRSVPLARYNRVAATCTADGGTQGYSIRELLDMRRWTNAATEAEWAY